MDEPRLRIGIIGCGRIADLQCLGSLEHPRARIVAVCDTDGVLAARRAAEWSAEHVYTDYRALLDAADVDAVDILTPHNYVKVLGQTAGIGRGAFNIQVGSEAADYAIVKTRGCEGSLDTVRQFKQLLHALFKEGIDENWQGSAAR